MSDVDVIVYTTETCPYCKMLVDFLDRQDISYEERNVTRQPEFVQQLVDLGTAGVPTSVVRGETVIGYDPERIMALTGRA